MSVAEIANELLVHRERVYDSLPKNQHGWPIFEDWSRRTWNWLHFMSGIYHLGLGSPLKPHIVTPFGTIAQVNLTCDTAAQVYEKQLEEQFEDCHTAREHKVLWKTSEAVKKSVESYKMKDYWTFIKAITETFHITDPAENLSAKAWLAIAKQIPFMDGIKRYDRYPVHPHFKTSLNPETMTPMTANELLRHIEVKLL